MLLLIRINKCEKERWQTILKSIFDHIQFCLEIEMLYDRQLEEFLEFEPDHQNLELKMVPTLPSNLLVHSRRSCP